MEAIKNVLLNHIEKVVLGVAVVFLLFEGISSTASRLDKKTADEVREKLATLERAHEESSPPNPLYPPPTFAETVRKRWAKPPQSTQLNPRVCWPPTQKPPARWPPWILTVEQPGEYKLREAATRVLGMPNPEVLGDVSLAENGNRLVGNAFKTGSTQIHLALKTGQRAIVPVEVRKVVHVLYPPVLLGGYAGKQMAVTVAWAEDPRQKTEFPVASFELRRMGPLKNLSQKTSWKNKSVDKEEQLLVESELDWTQLGPPWNIAWQRLGPIGDKMYYFDKRVQPNSWYVYQVASQATIQETLRQEWCNNWIAVKTPPGVHIYCIGTAVAEERKQATIIVLKWVKSRWEKYMFNGVWSRGSLLGFGKKADGKIGEVVRKDGEILDLKTPYVLMDVTYETKTIPRWRTRRTVAADGSVKEERVELPSFVQTTPKIVYEDKDGFQYEQLKLSRSEADQMIDRVVNAGPWDVQAPTITPERPERPPEAPPEMPVPPMPEGMKGGPFPVVPPEFWGPHPPDGMKPPKKPRAGKSR